VPEIAGDGIAMLDAIDIVANDVDVDLTRGCIRRPAGTGRVRDHAEAMLPVVRGASRRRVGVSGIGRLGSAQPERREGVSGLRLSEDVRVAIRHELEGGYTVSRRGGLREGMARAPSPGGDRPVTGSTLGMGDRGWGQMVGPAMLTDLAAT